MPLEVRRAAQRSRTDGAGRTTRHGLSFGSHYDPLNVAFGPLVAHNDERLEPGAGYPDHRHVDTEIVTWVVSGALRHHDDRGHTAVVAAGSVQVLRAGAGVVHSEVAAAGGPTRFVQSWLLPGVEVPEPTYATRPAASVVGGWSVLAGDDVLPLVTPGARLLLGVPDATGLGVPAGPRCQLFVVGGEVAVASELLGDGDELRATAPYELEVSRRSGAPHVLAWLLP
ncbi:MAG: pirin family protein [Marmoricola sp.]